MTQQKQGTNNVAVIMMILLFGMISFVTNLAAPAGVIWKNQFQDSNFLGMLGNFMNFLAYLCMGIPAGKLLSKKGYKKTALIAVGIGLIGVFIQFLSGKTSATSQVFSLPLNFVIYLLGAFVAGFSMCMLNTVVNPMLNLLGGGGNKGNQLIQVGGSFNSLVGTITPMLVGALIGEITKETSMSDINPVLFIAMGVFATVFVVLSVVKFDEPSQKSESAIGGGDSPWSFKHFVLGAIGIFIYVGVEIGIPGTLMMFLSEKDTAVGGGLSATVAGFVAGTYWLLMLVGRFTGASVGNKISSKTMLTVASTVGIFLVLAAIFSPISTKVSIPAFTGSSFEMVPVPINAMLLVLCGLCTSIMWGGIYNLAVEGFKGKILATASGIFMMMVVGGGILPLLQNFIADKTTYMLSYWVIFGGMAYLLYYALVGSKISKK